MNYRKDSGPKKSAKGKDLESKKPPKGKDPESKKPPKGKDPESKKPPKGKDSGSKKPEKEKSPSVSPLVPQILTCHIGFGLQRTSPDPEKDAILIRPPSLPQKKGKK